MSAAALPLWRRNWKAMPVHGPRAWPQHGNRFLQSLARCPRKHLPMHRR